MSRCDQCLRQIKEECRPVGRHRLLVMSFQKHEGGKSRWKNNVSPTLTRVSRRPFAVLSRFREQDPIHKFELQRFGGTFPAWLITRYDDCMAFLKDGRITRDVRRVMPKELIAKLNVSEDIDFVSEHMLAKDPPDHSRLRSLVHQGSLPG